jgi:hypothetical protein
MSYVLVLLEAIVLWLSFWLLSLCLGCGGCSCPPFISKGAGVTRKVLSRLHTRTLSLVFTNYKI